MPNNDSLVWLGYFSHVSEDISASQTRINLPIAALKPCCKASSSETIKPIFDNIFVLPDTQVHEVCCLTLSQRIAEKDDMRPMDNREEKCFRLNKIITVMAVLSK